MGTTILGTGSALPAQVITNDYFESYSFFGKDAMPIEKTSKEIVQKLETISGITERRFLNDTEESIDILYAAARNAVENAGIANNDIDCIIVAHNAGNMSASAPGHFSTVPNLAARLKNQLNVTKHNCVAYDILFGCPGWVQGVIQANRLIKTGEAKHVLVCGVEVASRFLDPHDMDSMLMGDGCGAAVLSASGNEGVISTANYSHCLDDLNSIVLGKSLNPACDGVSYFKMDGRSVFRYATTWLPQVIKEALDKASLTPRDIDLFFFHQANAKMLKVIAQNLMKLYGQENEPYEHKIPMNIHRTGNTSVATVPTLYDEVNKGVFPEFSIEKGKKYVLASVGAGMHCNAVIYQH